MGSTIPFFLSVKCGWVLPFPVGEHQEVCAWEGTFRNRPSLSSCLPPAKYSSDPRCAVGITLTRSSHNPPIYSFDAFPRVHNCPRVPPAGLVLSRSITCSKIADNVDSESSASSPRVSLPRCYAWVDLSGGHYRSDVRLDTHSTLR